jgi:hypothetical protein
MQEVKVFCTNVLSTNTAFAMRQDTGEQVFIPSAVAHAAQLKPTDTVTAHLVPNINHPEKTPWFAVHISRDGDSAPEPKGPPEKSLDERIAEYIEGQTLYATTSEVADEFSVDTTIAGNALNRLFRQGKIARADVYSKPEQQRVSFCLWAKDAARFVETEQ